MMLPDELEWVLEMLGYRWPTADEDKLRDSAALWRKFGDDVTELHASANASARTVVAHNAGESIDKFTKAYAKFDGGNGSDGYLANAAQAAYTIANVMEACAYLVVFAKWAVIAQLIALAFEIAAAQAAAPFTFGLSEVGALGATQATRLIVRRLLDELKEALMEAIVEAMKEPAISAIEAIITDLIRQTMNVGFGAQQGYDLGQTVKAGKDAGWDAIKQTPQTLAEGVRDSLGQKAGHRFHHAIDSRIDGYHGSGTEDGEGGDGGDEGSDSSSRSSSESDSDSGSSSDSSSHSSSHSSSDSSSDSSSSTSSDDAGSSGSDSSTSRHSDTSTDSDSGSGTDSGTGRNIGSGISADTGGAGVHTPDVGIGPDSHPGSDSGSGSGSDSGPGQNPSSSDLPTSRHTTSLADFDDPSPGGASHNGSNTDTTSGAPSTSGPTGTGHSSVSGISSPTPHAAPTHASSGGTASPTGGGRGGGIGTSIDSLAASAPTQSHAAPTPTTTDHSPSGTGGRTDGNSAMPTSPTPPSTTSGGPAPRAGASTPGSTSSTPGPTSPTSSPGPTRNPSSTTPNTPSPTGTGPASTPSPTSPATPRTPQAATPDGRTSGAGDGRTSGTGDRRAPGTSDGRIPTQRTPGTAQDGRTAPRGTPGTTPGDRTPPRTTPDDRTAPRNTPDDRTAPRDRATPRTDDRTTPRADDRTTPRNVTDDRTAPRNTPSTTPGDRTAPRNTPDATDTRTTPTRGQNPNANSDPSSNSNSNANSSTSRTPNPSSNPTQNRTTNQSPSQSTPSPTSSSTGPERTSNPGNQTSNASGTPGTQNPPGPRPNPNRSPNQPAGTAPGTPPHANAPQQPASQHNTSQAPDAGTDKAHDPQHHQVTPVPIHTVVPGATPPPHATSATPQPPGAPHADPGTSTQQHPHQDSLDDIRNDLDHYPGGLTEPHPDDQHALVNAVPHNPDGTPQRFPDPFGQWSQLQNDGGNQVPGRSNNCADCSRSFLETWYGNPQVSAPRTLDFNEHGNPDLWSPENNANANQIRWAGAEHTYAGTGSDPDTPARIAWDLHQAGHGAAAIVQVDWPGGGGHAFNAVNYHGNIVWIDTQSGEVSHQPLHIPNADRVWHIPLDANRNPIHPTPTDTTTSHNESDNPQEGTGTHHQESDNSPESSEDHKAPEPDSSNETPKKAPDENTHTPDAETAPHNPPLTEPNGHDGESSSHTEPQPTHADIPKTDGPSARHPSDPAQETDSESTHTTGESRNGNQTDRVTPQTGQPPAPDSHTTGTSTHQAPSGDTSRPSTGGTHPAGHHTTTTHAPAAPAGTHHQGPEEPGAGSPDSAHSSHTETHEPVTESHHPLDDPSRTDHPRLPERETADSTHYGMAPMEHQAALRETNNVRQVDLDPVHQQLNDWLTPVPDETGNGTRIPLVDALQSCSPPRSDDPDHKPTILRHDDLARILPGFADMHPGERGAVIASLGRLSHNFHASHAVGASPEPRDDYDSRGERAHASANWKASHRDDEELREAIKEEFSGITKALEASGEHRPDFTGRNYAAVEVYDPVSRQISYMVDSSYPNPNGKHSEKNLLDYLNEVNQGRDEGDRYTPLSMYSDREPCGFGQGYANCADLLSKEMHGVDVFYGTGYRKNAEITEPELTPDGGYKKQFDKDLAENLAALGKIWVRAMGEGGLQNTTTE